MGWQRIGRVVDSLAVGDWAVSHAMVPFVRATAGGLEMYFSSRDADGRSVTGVGELELDADGRVRFTPRPDPVVRPGALGGFDDSGAMGASIVEHDGDLFLYYIGWHLGRTVPFATYIGLAISTDGGATFARVSDGPVVGRTRHHPYLATSPWVAIEGDVWRLWHTNGVRWETTPEGPKHYYRIEHAVSDDGIDWTLTGDVCIDFADDTEFAIARPSVVRDPDAYRMWFSVRGDAYRIALAESPDGRTWDRVEGAGGLQATGDGWESRSVEYGCVFDHAGSRWMLYNGNDYGATGIGLARWEDDR